MTGGVGADATVECVGTGQAMETAIAVARAGSMVGFVGVPHGVDLPIQQMFFRTVGVRGGGAPVRVYLPELLDDVLAERIDPGTTRPTWTESATPTPRRTSAARSSRKRRARRGSEAKRSAPARPASGSYPSDRLDRQTGAARELADRQELLRVLAVHQRRLILYISNA